MRGKSGRHIRRARRPLATVALLGALLMPGAAPGGVLVTVDDQAVLPPIPLELVALHLAGTGTMPLGAKLGAVDVTASLSLTPGQSIAGIRRIADPLAPPGVVVQKELNDGDPVLFVDSFPDVLVDITIGDADATDGNNIAAALDAPVELSGIQVQIGAASFLAVVDTSQPNLGVRASPTALFSAYQIDFGGATFDLGADLDGDGNLDVLTLASPMSCFVSATDATGFPSITSALQCDFSGAINPPFSLLLDGRIDYAEALIFPAAAAVPEPAVVALLALGLTGIVVMRRRSYSGSSSVSQ